MVHTQISFIHGRSWAGEGDAAASGGRVQGDCKMNIKDNTLIKKLIFCSQQVLNYCAKK
jgi:hypothetical protein